MRPGTGSLEMKTETNVQSDGSERISAIDDNGQEVVRAYFEPSAICLIWSLTQEKPLCPRNIPKYGRPGVFFQELMLKELLFHEIAPVLARSLAGGARV